VKSILKQLVPQAARPWVRRQWTRVASFGWKRHCPVCGWRLSRFAPHGDPVEEEAVCPICASKAPHRLAFCFFQRRPQLFRPGATLLHVAPERELGQRLAAWCGMAGMAYRPGGLAEQGDQYLDLRATGLPAGSVHLLYCCHVLNAMVEDRAAIREAFRILHPQGTAVLQVPAFCRDERTLEPETREGRLAAFRDEFIYRFYTEADFVARLAEAGFVVETFRASEFSPEDSERWQLKRELLHVCRKAQ
jgi:hypothetical protein